jgi:hypothetical protein
VSDFFGAVHGIRLNGITVLTRSAGVLIGDSAVFLAAIDAAT